MHSQLVPRTTPRADPAPSAAASAPATRVLIVEDDPDFAKWIRHCLETSASPFQVDHVARLDAAMQHLEGGSVDAVLLDLSLPDGYGAFTVASACSGARDFPVLVLTSADDPQLASASSRAGASDFLVKQRVDRRALPEMILRAIREHRAEDETGTASPEPPHELYRRIARAAAASEPPASLAAVVVVGFDDLGLLQELFGTRLCSEVQRCAARTLDPERTGGRVFEPIGKGCFAAVLEGMSSEAAVARVCGGVIDSLAQIELDGPGGVAVQGLTASVGVAVYPWDGAGPATLVENARQAQGAAARAGGSRTCFHHQGEAVS